MTSEHLEERTALCSACANKGCPNYMPRTGFALFMRIVLCFTVGVMSVAIVICSFLAVSWSFNNLLIESAPPTTQSGPVEQAVPECGLGISVVEVGDMAEGAGLEGGLVIMAINPDSAVEGLDIKVNDVIIAADDVTIVTVDDLYAVLCAHKAGDEIRITVARFEDGSAVSHEYFVTLVPIAVE